MSDIKKNKLTKSYIKLIRKIKLVYIPFLISVSIFNFKKMLRVIYRNTPYEKIKNLKDKHKGERCFIIATGPSLTIDDLEKLKDCITISMNSICLAFEETNWRPTYYGIQDESVYAKFKKQIESMDVECKLISDTILKKVQVNMSDKDYIFPLNMLHHNYFPKKYNTKFSDNIFKNVYSGFTITYSLIQIAVFMGFKEIYLLGADCYYSSNMKHHFKDYDLVDPTYLLAGDMMTSAYKVAKKYADQNNIKIYNATRGGMLEVFERVDLDIILSKNTSSSGLSIIV